LDDIRKNVAQFPDRCYELQYEDLISQPQKSLQAVTRFCGLAWSRQFENEIKDMQFYNPVNKWKKYLSDDEGNLILEFFDRAEALNRA